MTKNKLLVKAEPIQPSPNTCAENVAFQSDLNETENKMSALLSNYLNSDLKRESKKEEERTFGKYLSFKEQLMGFSQKQPTLSYPSRTCHCDQGPTSSELPELFSEKYLRRIKVPAPKTTFPRAFSTLCIMFQNGSGKLWESRIDSLFSHQGGRLTQGVAPLPAFSTHILLGVSQHTRGVVRQYHSTHEVSSWPSLL